MQYAFYFVAILAVAGLLWFANRKGRPVRLWRLILRPAAFLAASVIVLSTSPLPGAAGLALYPAALGLGVAAGFLLVRRQAFSLSPGRGVVLTHMSDLGLVLFVLLFAGRFAFRAATNEGQIWHRLAHHSAEVTCYINAGFLFLLALSAVQSWQIWRRSRPLRQAAGAE